MAAPLTRTLLLDMEPALFDGLHMARAAMMLAERGETHDLEREEIAALSAVCRAAHTHLQSVEERWRAAMNEAS